MYIVLFSIWETIIPSRRHFEAETTCCCVISLDKRIKLQRNWKVDEKWLRLEWPLKKDILPSYFTNEISQKFSCKFKRNIPCRILNNFFSVPIKKIRIKGDQEYVENDFQNLKK